MEDLKIIFASNLIRLRTDAGLTQAQLAEKLNYSDKSVSKWERGDALPDVLVVKAMADLFGVTVDFMLTSHDAWIPKPTKRVVNTDVITAICIIGIWTVAALLFVIFWLLDDSRLQWPIFVYACPVSLITLLVLNSVWGKRQYNLVTVCLLVVSIFGTVYIFFAKYQPWQMLLLLLPCLVIACLSFYVYRKARTKKDK